ncbi:hypothetical protein [Aestuariispira ectoiniformans]|uniref:hypothetical protein n=1 Tax=Aestuariispira ectoiniformans TaxID=2775080 RepID=UPI00223B4047|nr:hypothetical protein [Aestuariispira ectoiniformans]
MNISLMVYNNGTRPAAMSEKAALIIEVVSSSDASPSKHIFLASAINGSREQLLIPPGQSKQFFYQVDFRQPFPDVFEQLGHAAKKHTDLHKCTFRVDYSDFKGEHQTVEIVLFDKAITPLPEATSQLSQNDSDEAILTWTFSVTECIGKIPQPLRKKFKIVE